MYFTKCFDRIKFRKKEYNVLATGSKDIFYTIQDKLDSPIRIFEPYLINPWAYGEIREAIIVSYEKLNESFDEDVLKRTNELSSGIPYLYTNFSLLLFWGKSMKII